ncbi:uncharacterized protein V6R79_000875 [Siganus canaliculatus]
MSCCFQRRPDISAEQWSPMAVTGDVRVTETLTPLVSLTATLLTSQFLQVVVQNQDPQLQAGVIILIMYVQPESRDKTHPHCCGNTLG